MFLEEDNALMLQLAEELVQNLLHSCVEHLSFVDFRSPGKLGVHSNDS